MRALAATGIAVTLAALTGGAEAREVSIYRGKCGEVVLPSGPTGLRSAIKVETRCGTFAIDGDGVRFLGVQKPRPMLERLTWRRGRLLFYDHGRIRWRSAQRYPRRAKFALVVRDGRSLAFHNWGKPLYIADFGGAERAVGHVNEFPLGWTRAGLLLSAQGQRLRAHTRSGRLVRLPGHPTKSYRFDQATRTLLFVSRRGGLIRTDGRRARTLTSVSSLRLGRWFQIEPLPSGRVALIGSRVVVLGADGAVVSSDRGGLNMPTESPDGAIATISTRYSDSYTRARESVRLLPRGERPSTLLFSHEFSPRPCAHVSVLAWRGNDLLYWTSEGHAVVIDSVSGEHLDLTEVVRRLPGAFQQAAWA